MRIVFSRDRPAQLDLLLSSLALLAPREKTALLWTATEDRFREGYGPGRSGRVYATETPVGDFNRRLRKCVEKAAKTNDKITFFCDDDVMYRVDHGHGQILDWDPEVLCFSLRLGSENSRARPARFPLWYWPGLEPTDFGFPGSIDGHTFRARDVVEMLGGDYIENPTQLETILAHRVDMFRESKPKMACYPLQRIVGVPVNRVSPDSGVVFGERYPQPVEFLNDLYMKGKRINLAALDFSGVSGCHHELLYQWAAR